MCAPRTVGPCGCPAVTERRQPRPRHGPAVRPHPARAPRTRASVWGSRSLVSVRGAPRPSPWERWEPRPVQAGTAGCRLHPERRAACPQTDKLDRHAPPPARGGPTAPQPQPPGALSRPGARGPGLRGRELAGGGSGTDTLGPSPVPARLSWLGRPAGLAWAGAPRPWGALHTGSLPSVHRPEPRRTPVPTTLI